MNEFWTVAVNAPLWQPLTYRIPEGVKPDRGARVRVPLGRRHTSGILLEPAAQPEGITIKDISDVLDAKPVLPEHYLTWLHWLSRYYVYPFGQVLAMMFPPLEKGGRGSRKKFLTNDPAHPTERPTPPDLTTEQQTVLKNIHDCADGFHVHLLWGVTGSGKTEIYLRLINECLKQNKATLFLVPEISLTPQVINRFLGRFGDQVAVLHSQLTEREKTEQWWHIVDGKKRVLIGARSALFCPVPDLGLIVIDEEHETSFKQEDHLRYHARDAAIMLAKQMQIPVVLGSATPSLESYKKAKDGAYHLHRMEKRVAERPLPLIEVLDLRQHRAERTSNLPHWLSETLFAALTENFARGKQSALFLNRRGVAPTLVCEHCGHSWSCSNCAIQLTVHGRGHLLCHYCGFHQNRPEFCSRCGEPEPKPLGAGTEKIEDDLRILFPQARIARADRDEVHTREDLEALIAAVETQQIDILVGTQMIAKGLDFPGLDLVGIVLADVGFNFPDFRAAERAFQLLTQVSGRSGRHVKGDERGRVILQTYNPDHPAVQFTLKHDFAGFAEAELAARRELKYPPYTRFGSIRISATDQLKAMSAARRFRDLLEKLVRQKPDLGPLQILGPTEAPLSKLKGLYRFYLLVKGSDPLRLSHSLGRIAHTQVPEFSNVRINVDIDPHHLL